MRLSAETSDAEVEFRYALGALFDPVVIEIGTRRTDGRAVHHRSWRLDSCEWIGVDFQAGDDVDVVADAHRLAFADCSVDVVLAISTWEHVRLPWVAAAEVARVLRFGGIAFIGTHHTFPRHGYPDDYTRWTTEGLAAMFEHAGLQTRVAAYTDPCRIVPATKVSVWDRTAPAWLCVDWYGTK